MNKKCMAKIIAAILIVFASLAGCGKNGSSSGDTNSQNPPAAMEVIAAKTVGPDGGTIADNSGETAVIVPPGAVTATTEIQILRGKDADGNVVTTFTADPPTSGGVRIVLPDGALLDGGTSFATQSLVGAATVATGIGAMAATCSAGSPSVDCMYAFNAEFQDEKNSYPGFWFKKKAYFYRTIVQAALQGSRTQGNRVSYDLGVDLKTVDHTGQQVAYQPASALASSCDITDLPCYQNKEAVLFVHGFLLQALADNGLGGGSGTWGNFPQLILASGGGSRFVPFEFRWSTAAKFQDVADDLCVAVDQIAERTGKKVHIVAHSFGGVLTRVYLQNMGTSCSYKGNVASVTTLGTPHSGILDDRMTVTELGLNPADYLGLEGFMGGQNSVLPLFEGCAQISCYQMGESNSSIRSLPEVFNAGANAGKLAADLWKSSKDLPAVRIQVLIGLTYRVPTEATVIGNGDGLITYEGQRFLPELTWGKTVARYDGLLNNTPIGGALVTERVLGFDEDIRPGAENPLRSRLFTISPVWGGYRHSGNPVGPLDSTLMANVEGDGWLRSTTIVSGPVAVEHSGLKHTRDWITKKSADDAVLLKKFTIRARVLDKATNLPLAGASVKAKSGYVENSGSTDQNGYVTIQTLFRPRSEYALVVSRSGYKGQEFPSMLITRDSPGPVELPSLALVSETAPSSDRKFAQLFVNVVGNGTVTGNGVACPGDCTHTEKASSQTQVVLRATADVGYVFSNWNDGCTTTSADGLSCYVTLVADRTISASFAPMTLAYPAILFGTTAVDFGNVIVGTCKLIPLVIKHVPGTGPATGTVIVSANTNAAFYLVGGNSFAVSSGTSAFVNVQFCPSSTGAASTTATVISGAAVVGSNAITLVGEGIIPATPPQQVPQGALRIAINPGGAPVIAGAQWKLSTESVWRNDNETVSGLSAGSYTVQFKLIPGWSTPLDQAVSVTAWNLNWYDGNPYVPTTAVLPAPSNLQVFANSDGSLSFTWTDKPDNSNNEDFFDLFYSTTGAEGPFNPPPIVAGIPANTTAYTVGSQSLTVGQYYCFRLRAYQNATALYSYSNVACGTPNVTAGAKPQPTVASGGEFQVALKQDGSLWSWGAGNLLQTGYEGSGDRSYPGSVLLSDVIKISAGDRHSLAIKPDERVFAWGANLDGQLGDGTTNQSTPKQVAGLSGISAVAAGYSHSVAVRGSDGAVWAWGSNANGELGDSGAARLIPALVSGISGVAAVSAGENVTVAVKSDGTVWAWGRNNHGEAGVYGEQNQYSPQLIGAYNLDTGTNISLTGIKKVVSGQIHNTALKDDGTVWSWGDGARLAAGLGSAVWHVAVKAVGLTGVIDIAAGRNHSLALKSDGTVWGWGVYGAGQLGIAGSGYAGSPIQVPGLSNVVAISAAADYSVAVRDDGTIITWGSGLSGVLGTGTTSSVTPLPVLDTTGSGTFRLFTTVSVGTASITVTNATPASGNGALDIQSVSVLPDVNGYTTATAYGTESKAVSVTFVAATGAVIHAVYQWDVTLEGGLPQGSAVSCSEFEVPVGCAGVAVNTATKVVTFTNATMSGNTSNGAAATAILNGMINFP